MIEVPLSRVDHSKDGVQVPKPFEIVPLRRRGVQLHLLPMGMAARKANTTRFNAKQGIVEWRLEWSFPSAPGFKPVDGR